MVKINTKAMPSIEVKLLCSALTEAMDKFYADPENQRRFEAWKAKRAKGGESS